MSSKKQPYFQGFEGLGKKEFGGIYLKGNAREQRPISPKRPMHLVMRSSLATGERSFLRAKRARKIHQLVNRLGKTHRVKIYRFANVGNHLHMIILPESRPAFKAFIRAVSGVIARLTLGAERGNALNKKFWDARPFTRILEWGRDFRVACLYVLQNKLEASGFIAFTPRTSKSPPS